MTLLLGALGRRRYWGELWCFFIGAVTSTYFRLVRGQGHLVVAQAQ
ncbi:MAG: hypothetical protein R3E68_14845 [Burkholderiaceae bacterium]